jgi:hypothetical protein
MKLPRIPYKNLKKLEEYFASLPGNRHVFQWCFCATNSRKYMDWLWDQYGARVVQDHGKKYLEFFSQEQITFFLLQWT